MRSVAVLGDGGALLDSGEFGSKAATLSQLIEFGYDCPGGVAVAASEYLSVVDSLGLNDGRDPESIASELREAEVPLPVLEATKDALRAISAPPPWIVRSSAVGEDGHTSSFAGQLDSIADVDEETLADAIKAVWASAWSSRAMAYRRHRNLSASADLPVAVLVQPYIEPDVAGVAFTSSPLPGQDGMLIECVSGRGELLVSGQAVPSRYLLDEFGFPEAHEENGTSLPAEIVRELWLTGSELARKFGGPQDIEWVFASGKLRIVQARPVTTKAEATSTIDPRLFEVNLTPVTHKDREFIPSDLADKDKFRLRLLATEAGVEIGKGWLVSVSRREAGANTRGVEAAAGSLAAGLNRSEQVSLVLQDPPRLDGGILRQFSRADEVGHHLGRLVGRVGASFDSFKFIATEILQARMSGISHIVDEKLVVEVAFGSYVPKGVVPTALYVVAESGEIEQHVPANQTHAIFIEAGVPTERTINGPVELTIGQLAEVRRLTEVVSSSYPDVSVEFGILADGAPYLIDIIPDMSVAVRDVRVMSEGTISGTATISVSDDLAAESLDAHFHSERSGDAHTSDSKVVVVAPRPFLALESNLEEHGSGSIGFVFEQGSLLGHLAIILREHGVPAIVIPGACNSIPDGQKLTINTSTPDLISFEGEAGSDA